MSCLRCKNQRWVCEDHREMPWNGGYPDCFCGGAGRVCGCHPLSDGVVMLDEIKDFMQQEHGG